MLRYVLMSILLFPLVAHSECDTVAIVFETSICQQELYNDDAVGQARGDASEKIIRYRLMRRIRDIAAEHLLPRRSYQPTEEEIQSYHTFMQKAREAMNRQQRELLSTIDNLLKTHQYDERNRKTLENAHAIYQRAVEQANKISSGNQAMAADMRKRFGDEAVDAMYEQMEETRYKMSRQWVSRWKMNKALYEKYGGRVIFQQAGIEPIDAYRDQLADIRVKGRLRILKTEYADLFDEFERYLDMGHNYLSENGKQYFAKPYWETVDLEQQHDKTLQHYRSIPYLE